MAAMPVDAVAGRPMTAFFAAVAFPNAGATQNAAPANAARFRKPRRQMAFSRICPFSIFIFGWLSIRCKDIQRFSPRPYQFYGLNDQFHRPEVQRLPPSVILVAVSVKLIQPG
jgi:hypothetical protein